MRSDPAFVVGQAVLVVALSLVVLVFDPQADDSFALPKSVVSYASAFALVPPLLYLLMRYGANALTWSWGHVAVLAVLLSSCLGALFSIDRDLALFGAERRHLGLAQVAVYVLLYFASAILMPSVRDVRRIALGIATLATIAAGYGLLQSRGIDVVRYKEGTTPIATLGQPDVLGGFLAITAVSAVAFATRIDLSLRARAAILVFALLSLSASFATGVRNGLLALLAGAAAIGIIAFSERRASRRGALAFGFAVAVVISVLALSPVAARLSPDALSRDPSVMGRLEIWRAALRAVAERPLVGIGPDNFAAVYPRLRSEHAAIVDGAGVLQNSPHDLLLSHLLAGGIIGLVAFGTTVVFAVWAAVRLARIGDERAVLLVPIGAFIGQGLVNVNDLSLDWWYWLSLGALAAAVGQRRALPFRSARFSSTAVLTAAALVVAVFVGNAQRNRVDAAEADGAAQALISAKRPLEAVQAAQRAITLDSGRVGHWMVFGTALAAVGNPSASANAFEHVVDRQPWNSLGYRNLVFQRLAQGDERRALDALDRALRLDPFDAVALDLSARLAYNRGEYERAATDGATAVRVAPQLVTAYDAPVNAYLQLQRPVEAESLLTTGLSSHPDSHLYVLLAKVRVARNDRPGALDAADRALAIDPNDADAKALRDQLTR